MKKIKLFLFISGCMLWMNQAESKEIELPGVLKSSSTTKSGSSNTRTDSYTCSAGSKFCIKITINVPDTSKVRLPYIPEDYIAPGQNITIQAEGVADVKGDFIEYKNSPVIGEEITTREHSFTTSTN